MSYNNGLNNLQQLFDTTHVGATGKSAASARTGSATGTGSVVAGSGLAGIGGDQAQVSTAAALLPQALSGSDVRFEKVAALQQSIAAGTYSVSSSDVADKLIKDLAAVAPQELPVSVPADQLECGAEAWTRLDPYCPAVPC